MKIYEAKQTFTCVAEIEDAVKLDSEQKVVNYMVGAFDDNPLQEKVYVLFLNSKNNITGRKLMTVGTQTACLICNSDILRAAIMAHATAIVLVHNHPSGDPSPSMPDRNATRLLHLAATAVGTTLLDHIIIGNKTDDPNNKGYFSFRDAGLL